ncbi:hypothetical protein ONZ45_g497 [Pleurotus djamor]|nr:hypothetical protein ONZ45_g497 [Pleurotus djamor]
MPITKDYSIAVDSTMSPSSPESSPQVVRRTGRTYGRRISEPASSSHSDDAGVESPASVYLTAPQRLDEEVPPSSDGFNAFSGSERADSDSEDPERPGESAPFQFEWQRRVNELSSDDEDAFPDIQFGNDNQAAQGASPTISGTSQVPPGELGRTEQSKEVALSSDLVESLPASPNSPLSRNTTFNKSSRRRRILPGDSDTELDSPLKSPSRSAIPSLFENNTTTTSNSQLILTSPTSDDEVASALFKKPTHPSKRSKTRSVTSSPHHSADEDHSDSSMGPRRTKQRGDSQRPNKKGKVKAPTKKELADTERARARLLAEQPASIARTNDPKKLTFKLLSRLQNRPVEVIAEPSAPSSDPITQFDSSPVVTTTLATANNKSLQNLRPLGIIPPLLDDEDDLPDVRELSRAGTSGKSHSILNEQKKLWLAKGKAVGRTSQVANDAESDDDLVVVESVKPSSDMHVVAQEAAAERRTQKQRHLGPSKGKRMVERLAHPRKETDVRKLTQADLLKQLKGDIYRQNIDICEQKEAAWEGVGGTVGGSIQPAAEPQALAADAANKLARSLQASVEGKPTYEESNDEASDEEYVPPPDDEAEAELVLSGDEDVTMVDDEVPFFSSQETENDDATAPVLRRSRAHVVLNSDSENDDESENRRPKRTLPSQSPVPSIVEQLSSLDERTEDEDDKENSTGRMYDKGDDKENKAVVRHGIDSRLPFGPRKVSGLGRNDTRLSLSPGTPGIEDSASQSREPFKDLLSDEDPFKSPSQISFTARLLQTSPKSSSLPSQQFTPQKLGGLAFSQDEDQENCENVFEPKALQPSFSQMFQSQTQVASSSAFGGLHKLRDSTLEKDLPLTLDLPLQPALDVDENIRKQADDVFEREQEYILEALQPKAPPTQPKVYIDDHGFLTQTRPDVDSPEVYKMFSPSQPNPSSRPLNGPNFLSQTPVPTQGPRHPLRTISYSALDELDETPSVGLNRLRRHRSPSLKEDGYGSSPTQSPVKAKQQNAFDILSRNAMRQGKDPRKGTNHRDGVAKEFLQDEAEESDDEMGNWGPRRSKDEEEEEGDADTTLVELMDDNVVDENANKVIEKFQEHQQEDDEKLQKYHQNAVDGKFRHKKRNHLGFDSSDDEGSDEEDAARRRKMYKRARIERDHIKRLGQSDETKAFAMVYQDDLVDDQILVRDSDDIMAEAQPNNDNEEGSDSDGVNDAPNVISAQDVRRELREKAESGDFQVYDVNDVSWLDDEDEPSTLDDIQIKQASNRPRLVQTSSSSSKRRLLDIDIDLDSRPSSQRSEAQSNDIRGEQWARSERRSGRLETTGRSVSRVAVTGHKGGSGGVRMKGVKQSSSVSSMAKSRSSKSSGPVAPGKREVKASRSMVLGAVDRRGRFE